MMNLLAACRPLSRLTYCAYLIHPLVIWLNYRNMEVTFKVTLHPLYVDGRWACTALS